MSTEPLVNELSVSEIAVPRWLVPVGRAFYAIGLIGIGAQHFIFHNFIPVIVPLWPAWAPGRTVMAFVVGALLIAAGVAILFGYKARTVAAITGAALLLLVVIDDVPSVLVTSPMHLATWTNAFKALAFVGGAWVVAGSLGEGDGSLPASLERWMPVGRYFLAVMVIAFGIDHFLYAPFVKMIVPGWAGSGIFWTYFAGVALIASGLGMIAHVLPRLAALMLGIMIFLWVWMLHLPRALTMDASRDLGNEWTSVFEALAFSGIALMLAALPRESRFSIASRR